jgi:RNA-directed DNA polymerase
LGHSAACKTMQNRLVLSAIASAFMAGEQTVEQAKFRATLALGRSWRWLGPLAQRYLAEFAGSTRPSHRTVVRFLLYDPGFAKAWWFHSRKIRVAHWSLEEQRMLPVEAAGNWPLPPIESAGALATWLGVTPGELDWFADLKGLTHNLPKLSHYHYRLRTKGCGGIRLVEAPKPRLKHIQQHILTGILDHIPPHPAVHGFRKGRSIRTFVAPHVGQRVILRMDLKDFFPSISGPRIQAFFRTAGYPDSVAAALGGICTNATPKDVWRHREFEFDPRQISDASALYSRPHLPQGAPASPALANFCAWRVDCRLSGLATAAGATYTRYADDLAFSGGEEFERRVQRFSTHVAAVLQEEGFSVHHRKTRIMRQGVRQHLAGLVANRSVNVIRADFDLLKAILTNCVRSGPESQNREPHPNFRAHLEGRVGFVEMINPTKGKRLRAILNRIEWP